MKAIIINQYGGPEVLEYKEIEKPVPGPGEVLIKTEIAAVNPADWKVRKGNLKIITGKKFPMTLGIEASGIVEETGPGVKAFRKGQHVFAANNYTTGCYAEYFKISEKNIIHLPDGVSFEDSASIAVTGTTAYQCLVRHGKLKEGMKVLINGASGGVGIMAVQIAKFLGAEVTGICSGKNVNFVKNLGADKVTDYQKVNFLEKEEKYDIILDCAAMHNLSMVKHSLNRKGILIKLNLSLKTFRDQVFSSMFGKTRVKLVLLKRNTEDFKWVRDQIVLGNLKVIIEKIFPLKDCSKAHEVSESLRARGKVLLKP